MGNFLKPLVTINLPKSPTFLGNFKGVKCVIFLMKSFLGNFQKTFGDFYLVTLNSRNIWVLDKRATDHLVNNIRRLFDFTKFGNN